MKCEVELIIFVVVTYFCTRLYI